MDMEDYGALNDLQGRMLFIGPTSTPEAEDINVFNQNKDELISQMKWIFGQTGRMYPTAWIFISRDPNTGAKLEVPEMGVISLVGGFRNEIEKEVWNEYISRIVYEGQAIAIITAMESWIVEFPKDSVDIKDLKPSVHPDRKECLWVLVEHISDFKNSRTMMAEVIRGELKAELGDFKENSILLNGRMSGYLANSLVYGKKVGIS